MVLFDSICTLDPDTVDSPMIGLAINNHANKHGKHAHQKGQLMYCRSGVMHLYCRNRYFILPPTKAAWIPSGLEHDSCSKHTVCYRSLYIDLNHFPKLPEEMFIFHVEPLLKLLIEKACFFDSGYSPHSSEYRMATVIVDIINQSHHAPLSLPLPEDSRLRSIFQFLQDDPGACLPVDYYAGQVGISARTLHRLCHKELGMSFEKWRLEIKLMNALELLEQKLSVTEVTQRLGYNNDSTFITKFKQWFGDTPAQYRRKIHL